MPDPQVDILLATYNGEQYLREFLNSIESQSHQNWKMLVRDDLSTDSTRKILDEFSTKWGSKVLIIKSCDRVGAKLNFSELMNHSTAPYIMFADQDDVWDHDKIEKSLDLLLKSEKKYGTHEPILVHTDLRVADNNLRLIAASFSNYAGLNPEKRSSFHHVLIKNVVTGCTMIFNRALLNLGRPIPNDAIMHDWWLALVACAMGKVEYLNVPTIDYRQHGNNTIGAKRLSLWKSVNKLLMLKFTKQPEKLRQTLAFYQRYGNAMSNQDLRHYHNFVNYETSNSRIRRFLFLFKWYGFD